MKWYLLILISWLLPGLSKVTAQEFSFDNRIQHLHLPSLETYKVIQDRKGYIWLATEFGLYRYEAGGAVYIPTNRGALHAAALTVYETAAGGILVSTIQGRIFRVSDSVALELPFSEQWSAAHSGELIYRLAEDDKQQLYIMTSVGTYKSHGDYTNAARVVVSNYPFFPVQKVNGLLLPFNDFFHDNRSAFHDIEHPLTIGFPGLTGDTVAIDRHREAVDVYRILTATLPGYELITYSRTLMIIGPDRHVRRIELPADIITLRTDANGGIWIGMYKNGYLYIADPAKPGHTIRGLAHLSVSDICVDREGSIWVTTLERGVWYSEGASLLRHTEEGDGVVPFKKLFKSNEGVLAGVHGKPTLLIKKLGPAVRLSLPKNETINGLISFAQSAQWDYYFTPHLLVLKNRVTGSVRRTILSDESLLDVYHLGQDNFVAVTASRLMLLRDMHIDSLAAMKFFSNNLLVTHDSQLLIGTRNNLYRAQTLAQPRLVKEPGISGNVLKIEEGPDGTVWIMIQNKGLFVLQKGVLRQVLTAAKNEMYYTFSLTRPGEIWLASNLGLLAYKESSLISATATTSADRKLITTDKVYSLVKSNDRVYMATTTGIVSMPMNHKDKAVNDFPVYLRTLRAGNNIFTPAEAARPHQFGYNDGAITWTFDIISFKQERVTIHYALSGPKADSGVVNAQTLQLGNLRYGDYQLTVWCTRADGAASNTLSYSFTIFPPYWQTAGFFWTTLLAVIILTTLIAWRVILRLRNRDLKKRKIEQELLSSRLLALQAQMNPHFIFNAINSIQYFVLYNREQEGYHYLAQFSKLIRRVLMQSRNPLLTLSAELETLSLYIELEQLRFPVQFEYVVIMAPGLRADEVYLPVMLLQPIIENAIQHGISDHTLPGRIVVEIIQQPALACIHFIITDNGTGEHQLNKTKVSKNEGHVPVSSIINRERIDTLNKIYQTTKFDLQNLDLYAADGSPVGMTVTISIPDNLKAYV